MAVNDVGSPAQFLYRFEYAACIEDCAFGVVCILITVFIVKHLPLVEVVVVVDEVYLHACGLNACHFDDERMVRIVDDDVQS